MARLSIALGGHGDRYTRFVIQAFQHGIQSVVMVDPYAGNSGKHVEPANPAVGRQWQTPALSDADPDGFKAWFAPELAELDAANVRIAAFELGNELNTPRFNGDFPVDGTHRVLGLSDLDNSRDSEGHTIATGYLAYLKVHGGAERYARSFQNEQGETHPVEHVSKLGTAGAAKTGQHAG